MEKKQNKKDHPQAPGREQLLDLGALLLGPALVAAGLTLFTIPNHIAPGGVSGLATALDYILPLGVGLWTLTLNLPLLLFALYRLGLRPLIKTLAGTVLLSFYIELFSELLPAYTNNVLLAACLGGVLCGAGLGLLFARGGSTGGTDLATLLLARAFPNLSMGTLLLCVDALVVLFAMAVFSNLEVGLYSIVTLYVTTKVIDSLAQGLDFARMIYVITERGEAISGIVTGEMGRGVTVLDARGGFTGKEKQVLLLVIRRNMFSQVLRAIKQADPEAFIVVTSATEVHGEGFKPMDGV